MHAFWYYVASIMCCVLIGSPDDMEGMLSMTVNRFNTFNKCCIVHEYSIYSASNLKSDSPPNQFSFADKLYKMSG